MTKKIKVSIGRVLAIFFVILYVAGTPQLAGIHSITHNHAVVVSHTDEQERDPCHRSIYHRDIDYVCHHDSHCAVSDECQMCDIAGHGDQIYVTGVDILKNEFESASFASFKESIDSHWAVISSSRAPPVSA